MDSDFRERRPSPDEADGPQETPPIDSFDRNRLPHTFLAGLPDALRGADFPASRDELVEMAQMNGADAVLVDGLKDLPAQDYDNVAAVLAEIEANRSQG